MAHRERLAPTLSPATGGLFAFGGIRETAHDPDGGEIDTAANLTVEAGADVSTLHCREPVAIQPANYSAWLKADETDAGVAQAMIGAAPPGWWTYRPVSKALNNARNEGEALARFLGQIAEVARHADAMFFSHMESAETMDSRRFRSPCERDPC